MTRISDQKKNEGSISKENTVGGGRHLELRPSFGAYSEIRNGQGDERR